VSELCGVCSVKLKFSGIGCCLSTLSRKIRAVIVITGFVAFFSGGTWVVHVFCEHTCHDCCPASVPNRDNSTCPVCSFHSTCFGAPGVNVEHVFSPVLMIMEIELSRVLDASPYYEAPALIPRGPPPRA